MICPNDRSQMVNYTKEKKIVMVEELPLVTKDIDEVVPLPNGGIATDDVYETWYVYECPKCKRRVKESYRCEVLSSN